MKNLRLFLLGLSMFFIQLNVFSQDCNCTISAVNNNSVVSCELIIGTIDTVFTAQELKQAIIDLNASGGNKTILIADGEYALASPSWYPYITANDVVFRSLSGNRDAVIITGTGMSSVSPDVENGFYFVGDNITIADLTIRNVGNHGLATQGDYTFVHNVRFQNTYEQMLKGTGAGDGADNGIVQCSLFEYTEGIGPQFYIGGLDIHKGDDWIVRDNIFKNIASPSGSLAEHAVHFWNSSSNNTVERNWIINCDRGVGFGLGSSPNEGGIIRNNMIYNNGAHPFHDVGIGLESSPNTEVYNNTVFIEYPNAIEYRFEETNGVLITNNLTNKLIKSRNGGQATLTTNFTEAQSSWFENTLEGNLRLNSELPQAFNTGTDLSNNFDIDIDQMPRPQGVAFDIGAHEFLVPLSSSFIDKNYKIDLYPNPATNYFSLHSQIDALFDIAIFNLSGTVKTQYHDVPLANGFEIDIKNWQAGSYICKITKKGESAYFKKLIIFNL